MELVAEVYRRLGVAIQQAIERPAPESEDQNQLLRWECHAFTVDVQHTSVCASFIYMQYIVAFRNQIFVT